MAEWSKAHAWKVCIRQRIEGSNPSLSANIEKGPVGAFFGFVGDGGVDEPSGSTKCDSWSIWHRAALAAKPAGSKRPRGCLSHPVLCVTVEKTLATAILERTLQFRI